MCEPTTALLATGTALSAGGGVMSAISGHQSGMASYRAQRAQTKLNNQRMMQEWAYRNAQRDREWQQTLKIYDLKVKQHKAQVIENNESLYRAYTDGQVQLNNFIDQTKQQNFDAFRRLAGIQGQAAASDRQGRRANMVDKYNAMSIGIEQGRRLSDITKYTQAYQDRANDMRRKTAAANQNSWYGVSIAPQPTTPIPQPILAPQTAVAPSSLGMWGSIAGSVGQGVMGMAGHFSNAGASVNTGLKTNSIIDGALIA